METMQTIPGLLAAVGLIPTASAKPGRRNDVSEPLYGVLESSEMHPVKSMMTFPVLGGGGVHDHGLPPPPVLSDVDLAAGPLQS